MFRTSWITPCPATAASPWISTGSTWSPFASPRRCWRARTEPSTTGLTDLEVRRIERERQVHRPARRDHVRREALVVLDVAGGELLRVLALELGEEVRRHLAQRVDEHVEAPAVRHADHRSPARPARRRSGSGDRASGSSCRRPRPRSASGRRTSCAGSARASRPRSAARGCAAAARRVIRRPRADRLEALLDEALGRRVEMYMYSAPNVRQ